MQHILWEGDTSHGHYQVVDTLYDGRLARVLYSGNRQAAQSGIPKDAKPELLFDYNQRLLELVTSVDPARVLLIGGGVCTLPKALIETLPDIRIDIVELDAQLIELAHTYFDLPVSERLSIYNADGRTFLSEHATRYDMILIDAFTHTTIPKEIRTVEAFEAYYKHLRPKGICAMNVISGYHGSTARTLEQLYAAVIHSFDSADIFLASRGYSLWLPQNFILTAQKGQQLDLKQYMRYEAVKPPEVSPDAALTDEAI